MKKRVSLATVVWVFVTLVPVNTAYAYLDPNVGSAILQHLLGGLTGFLLLFRFFRRHLFQIFIGHHRQCPSLKDQNAKREVK